MSPALGAPAELQDRKAADDSKHIKKEQGHEVLEAAARTGNPSQREDDALDEESVPVELVDSRDACSHSVFTSAFSFDRSGTCLHPMHPMHMQPQSCATAARRPLQPETMPHVPATQEKLQSASCHAFQSRLIPAASTHTRSWTMAARLHLTCGQPLLRVLPSLAPRGQILLQVEAAHLELLGVETLRRLTPRLRHASCLMASM